MQPIDQSQKKTVGYHLLDTHDEQQKALQYAFELVSTARRIGLTMRTWARQTNEATDELMVRLKKDKTLTPELKLWELSTWESKILTTLRDYMSEISDLLSSIKTLNPPLLAEQVRPFIDAIGMDRTTTVDAMTPLTHTVARLTSYKLNLSQGEPTSLFDYRPT